MGTPLYAFTPPHPAFFIPPTKMAAIMPAPVCLAAPAAARVQSRKNFAGAKVAQKKAVCKATIRTTAVCKSEKENVIAAAAVAATVATAFVAPEAQAAVTPSLQNTLSSFVAGGVVVGAIAGAVPFVSGFDRVNRK